MTTKAPVDDPDSTASSETGPAGDAAGRLTEVEVGATFDDGEGDDLDGGDERPSLRHPIQWWEWTGRRFLPGITFPIAVWAVWRVAQFLLTWRQVGPVANPFLSSFDVAFNYDGERYLLILHQGYANANTMMPNTAFFPMLSWIAAPFWWITRSDAWTVHLVASLTAITAFSTVWGVTKVWVNEVIARRAALLLALMPSSLFLWAFYSEGLFISLGAGAVIADRKGKHWLAAALLAPLAATRSVGILIPAVIVLARIIRQRRVDWPAVLYSLAGIVGLGAVVLVMWKQTGNPIAFIGEFDKAGNFNSVQEDWGRGLSAPWTTVVQGFDNLYPKPETIMIPALVARNFDLWSLLLVGVPLFYAMGASAWSAIGKSRLRRELLADGEPVTEELLLDVGWSGQRHALPMETWMIGWALIALPLCSSALASFNRFAMATWVIYPVFAVMLARIPAKVRWVPYLVLAGSSVWVSYLMVGRYAADRFVG